MALVNRDRIAWWASQARHVVADSIPLIWPFLLFNFVSHFVGSIALVAGIAVFISFLGTAGLPWALAIAVGISVVVAAFLSWGVGRIRQVRLVQVYFWALGSALLVLRLLLYGWPKIAAYGLFAVGEVSVPLAIALLWGFFGRYFTVLDIKRFTSPVHIAGGLGAVCGSLLVTGLAWLMRTENMLYIAVIGAGAQLFIAQLIGQLREELLPPVRRKSLGMGKWLRLLGRFQRTYPIVMWLLAGAFIARTLDTIMKVEVLEAIAGFLGTSEQRLTQFVGGIYAAANISIFGCFAVARPFVRWVGVAWINVLYPMATLLALAIFFATDRNIIAAVLVALNYLALIPSLYRLIFNLNVIAVPRNQAGRVRLMMLGVAAPLGLFAGAMAVVGLRKVVGPTGLVGWAVLLAALGVVVGFMTGRAYARSLVSGVQRGTFTAREFAKSHWSIPEEWIEEAEEMLRSDQPSVQRTGILLATRASDGSRFLPAVLNLLPSEDRGTRSMVANFLRKMPPATLRGLTKEEGQRSLLAAIALVCRKEQVHDGFFEDDEAKLDLLAVADRPEMVSMVREMYNSPSMRVRTAAMEALAKIAVPANAGLLTGIAADGLKSDHAPLVKAAIGLASGLQAHRLVTLVGQQLEADELSVRLAAAVALWNFGGAGFEEGAARLHSWRQEVVLAAIHAVGGFSGHQRTKVLYDALEPMLKQVKIHGRLPRTIRAGSGLWRFVSIPVVDYNHRTADLAIETLAMLGSDETAARVREGLTSQDETLRAAALETFGSLKPRRFSAPLLAALEKEIATVSTEEKETLLDNPEASARIQKCLLELMESDDRWLALGSRMVWETLWPEIEMDAPRDEWVHETLQGWRDKGRALDDPNFVLNQLFFLREVTLLAPMNLHELSVVMGELSPVKLEEGEKLQVDDSIYIIRSGAIADLRAGDYVGEAALFYEEEKRALIATEKTALWAIDAEVVRKWAEEKPRIWLRLAADLSRRLREIDHEIANPI